MVEFNGATGKLTALFCSGISRLIRARARRRTFGCGSPALRPPRPPCEPFPVSPPNGAALGGNRRHSVQNEFPTKSEKQLIAKKSFAAAEPHAVVHYLNL